jgi:sterol desaturase/sphingolipid hydroxylase (fatty acid hydroxylase superfamily)
MSFDRIGEIALGVAGGVASQWLTAAIVSLLLYGVFRRFTAPRRIQPGRFDWRVLRHEIVFSALTLSASGFTIGATHRWLRANGWLRTTSEPGAWWVGVAEFALYFLVFDLYFYLVHRLMHWGPIYHWVHATHHRSTAPNPLTAFSFNPIEGVLTGAFLPVFMTVVELHRSSLWPIYFFQPVMSMLIHSGHELYPRWWYRTWLTKWWLTPMFHDQHHQLFHCNYGGFTTLWDRLFGTANPSFESDFERLKQRAAKRDARAGAPLRSAA